jgi:hypothetical protein
MELQLRPSRSRFPLAPRSRVPAPAVPSRSVLVWGPGWGRGLRGLGQTCQVPQPGVPMVYPACPTYSASGPATYVAPTSTTPPACTQDTRPGGAAFSAECQAQLQAYQQAQMAADNAANRAVFVENCNRDWQANAVRYQELGMAVPPNDCAYRGYGQTLPGTTGSYAGYLPGTPQEILDWRAANPGGGSPGPVAGGGGTTGGGLSPSFAFTNLTSGDNTNFKVGDRWQILVTGPPNAPVSFNGGRNGENQVHPMGSTDSTGKFTLNGQMGQGEIGDWAEAWRVNNQIVASFSFHVLPSSSVTTPSSTPGTGTGTGSGSRQTTQSSTSKSVFDTLPGGSVEIGGMDIPWALIGGGLVVAYFMFKGGR